MVNLKHSTFLERAHAIHGNKYTYQSEYIKSTSDLAILCPIHGLFYQKPQSHLRGHGCVDCSNMRKSSTLDKFINKARKIHGNKYDYSKVNYVNNTKPVIIICPIHGEFKQTPNNHTCGNNCPKCSKEKIMRRNGVKFVNKAKIKHGDRYDYSNLNYNGMDTDVTINCRIHGSFNITPRVHLLGFGCSECEIIDERNNNTI